MAEGKKRRIGRILIALALVVGVVLAVQRCSGTQRDTVEELTAERGDVRSTITVSGTVDRTERRDLAFQAFGTVNAIHVQEGDRVTKGALLATLEAPTVYAQYREADLARQRAVLEEQNARRHWDDYTPEERDVYGNAVAQAAARVSHVAATLRQSKLYAPIAGVVTKIDLTEGEFAKEQRVMTIADGDFRIEALVSEADITALTMGQEVEVSFDALAAAEPVLGNVSFIAQQATTIQDVVYYEVYFTLSAQPEALRIGMTADAFLVADERTDVVRVPSRAIIYDRGTTLVRVPQGDTYEEQQITVGLTGDDGMVEVLEGLAEGDTVVVTAATD